MCAVRGSSPGEGGGPGARTGVGLLQTSMKGVTGTRKRRLPGVFCVSSGVVCHALDGPPHAP